ncbi:MAG TPA: N-acetyltransferase [Bryobacteraceae bacterium]|nr:N-acetyltransferase [Bryobacteraceae bacterium]
MHGLSDLKTIDLNLRIAMRFFGQATGGGSIQSFPSVEAVYSGLDYGVFNIAFLTERVSAPRDLGLLLACCGRYYHERAVNGCIKKVRWSFWLCEDLLDLSARRRSRDVFFDAGLRPISQAPGMIAASLAPPSRPLPEIECCAVKSAPLRSAFTGVTSVCFDIPIAIASAVYEPEGAWQGEYRGFVGFAHGQPVSIVALVHAEGALGIYSLGTLPEYRRRGYGEALLRAAIAQMQDGEAPHRLVLESTEAGYPLYRRLGFRDAARFTVYLTK